MFVNQSSSSDYRQRRGGNETLVQWQNGDQRWLATSDLQGDVRLVNPNQIGGADEG